MLIILINPNMAEGILPMLKFKHQIHNQQIFQAPLLLMFKLPIRILFT